MVVLVNGKTRRIHQGRAALRANRRSTAVARCPAGSLHRERHNKRKLFIGGLGDAISLPDEPGYPTGQRLGVNCLATKIRNDTALVLVYREIRTPSGFECLIVNTAQAVRFVVGRASFSMGVVGTVHRTNFHGSLACRQPPVEGSARLVEPPECLDLLPIQFEDERIEATTWRQALGAVRDNDSLLIAGGGQSEPLRQKTSGIMFVHLGAIRRCYAAGTWTHVIRRTRRPGKGGFIVSLCVTAAATRRRRRSAERDAASDAFIPMGHAYLRMSAISRAKPTKAPPVARLNSFSTAGLRRCAVSRCPPAA